MRVKLTPGFVLRAKAETGRARSVYWDVSLPRFGLSVTASGARSWIIQYKRGRTRRVTLPGVLSLGEARRRARVLLGQIAAGGDPMAEKKAALERDRGTLDVVAGNFFDRQKGRTADERRRAYERMIGPTLGRRPIGEIRRGEITRLLENVNDERGPAAAEKALKLLRRVMAWHAARDDDFRSPIVPGMWVKGSTPRSRILADDELRQLWRLAEERGDAFSFLLRFYLLTATRRDEARYATWSEIAGADWIIPAARYKTGRDHLVPLSKSTKALLERLPRINSCSLVFTGNGRTALGVGHAKREFVLAADVTGWTLHDLRRTARSLMSRAGVNADIAERCLGHVIGGVRGIYDRYEYRDEKAHAFEALAAQIERIVDPQPNVTALRRG